MNTAKGLSYAWTTSADLIAAGSTEGEAKQKSLLSHLKGNYCRHTGADPISDSMWCWTKNTDSTGEPFEAKKC